MAPSKLINASQVAPINMTLRSQVKCNDQVVCSTNINGKRKNDENPSENEIKRSRSAFSNLSNEQNVNDKNKQKIADTANKQEINQSNKITIPNRKPKIMTRAAVRAKARQEATVISNIDVKDNNAKDQKEIHSVFLNNSSKDSSSNEDSSEKTISANGAASVFKSLPIGVIDFDKELSNDPYEVSEYAMDIFNYLKEREKSYPIQSYMNRQPYINETMRSVVVDWMAGVQQAFTLHNESLYLAVKIFDSYLGQKVVHRNYLQLLGAVSLYLACKYDEGVIPIEDFTYICDDAYTVDEVISMELDVFKTLKCDVGFPLSYNFLRRYARCAFISLAILTLARFILEHSLMNYATITLSDSKMASAALYIALRMFGKGWSATLEYYSGYKLTDFVDIVILLNNGLHSNDCIDTNQILKKYSSPLKKESKVSLLSIEELFNDTQYLSMKERETLIKFANMKLSVDE